MISEEELKRIEAGEPMGEGVVTYLISEIRDLQTRLQTARDAVDLGLSARSKLHAEVKELQACNRAMAGALRHYQDEEYK